MNATNDIRYVCLSDLHLGEEDSLLTGVDAETGKCDPLDGPVPVLDGLAERLAELICDQAQKPTLILLGDVLELALATDNVAAMAFERFIDNTFAKTRLFDGIVYVPGNHDHHVWESARETQYVQNYLTGVQSNPDTGATSLRASLGTTLQPSWHTTSMFILEDPERHVDVYLANALVHRFPGLQDVQVLGAYPHFALRTSDGVTAVLFHHGHLLEDLYHLMSTLRFLMFGDEDLEERLDDIEALNFAWIDFFWSTMGRSGRMGAGIELLYEVLSQRPEQLRDYADSIARGAARKWDIPYVPTDWLEEQALRAPIRFMVELVQLALRGHRRAAGEACDDALRAAIRAHLGGPVERALVEECISFPTSGFPADLPEDVTFVFGHTHKPFSTIERVRLGSSGAIEPRDLSVKVYNLGGWVIDTADPDPLHGAAAFLLDDDLNGACLPLYQEGTRKDVTTDEVLRPGEEKSEFCRQLALLLRAHGDEWNEWESTVSRVREERAARLGQRVAEARAKAHVRDLSR